MPPNTTFIIGGSGKVARHLTRLLVSEEKHAVHSLIRNPDQSADIKSLGATPVVQSLEETDVSSLSAAIKNADPSAVVFAAGAGAGNPARTEAVDHLGAVKAFDATAAAGVKRFVIISAIDVRDRENKPLPSWYDEGSKDRSDRSWGAIGAYMAAKLKADRDLRTRNGERKLDYTIVRPGGLSQDPSSGKVSAGKVSLTHTISREDVARVVIEVLRPNSGTNGLAFDVVGGDTPISQAIQNVANDKTDTFEGFY